MCVRAHMCASTTSARGVLLRSWASGPAGTSPLHTRPRTQASWREDEDKLTFIILDRSLMAGPHQGVGGTQQHAAQPEAGPPAQSQDLVQQPILAGAPAEGPACDEGVGVGAAAAAGLGPDLTGAMAGDVNIFFEEGGQQGRRGSGDGGGHRSCARGEGGEGEAVGVAEVEVMVAEAGSRRKGIAREAVTLMMAFAAQRLRARVFR